MDRPLRVALLQILPPKTSQEEDFISKGEDYCRRAAKQGADMVLFPELWNIGYTFPVNKTKESVDTWHKQAINKESPFTQHFQKLAAQLNIAIAITYLESTNAKQKPLNSVSLYDRFGTERLHYSKVHTCDFGDEILTKPGHEFKVATIPTLIGDVKIGLMICFDREIPESARLLMLDGAEIVIIPNASFMQEIQLNQLSVRAFENMIGVAMANYPAPKCNGASAAFSPITEDERLNSVNNCLAKADAAEQLVMCEFDMSAIRSWRKKMIWGNKHRRPHAYRKLLD